jgi:D-alanyl-D-alanine carboxypeptidase
VQLPFRGAAIVARGDSMLRVGDTRARYLVYSVAKAYLGVIAVRLASRGVFSLDEEYAYGATLRQLLLHTSGLPDYGTLPEYEAAVTARPGEAWSDDEFLARALAHGRGFEPGAGWAYSNTGYLLVRRAIDEAVGLERALREEIVEPLGLRDTRWALAVSDLDGLEPGEARGLGGDVQGVYDPKWVAHRTLVSTAEEVLAFWRALLAGALAPLDELLTAVPVGDEPGFGRPSYGLGVMVDPEWPGGGTLVGHGGGGPGYRAGAFGVVGGPIVVVLSNEDGADAQGEALRLLAAAAA